MELSAPFAQIRCSQRSVLFLAASKFFHHLATPVLYSSPIIRGPTALKSLVTTLKSASSRYRPFNELHAPRAAYVHSLSLQDLSAPDWLIAQELGHLLVSSAPSPSTITEVQRGRPLYRRRTSRERLQASQMRRYPLQTLSVECAGRDLTNAMPFFQQLDVLEAFEWNTAPCWLIRPAELFTALLVSIQDTHPPKRLHKQHRLTYLFYTCPLRSCRGARCTRCHFRASGGTRPSSPQSWATALYASCT